MRSLLRKAQNALNEPCHYDTIIGLIITLTLVGRVTGPVFRVIYWLQGLLGIRSRSNYTEQNAVGVLGRGTSLSRAEPFNQLDLFITANFRTEDIATEPVESLLQDSMVVLVGNRCEPLPSVYDLLRLDVVEYRLGWVGGGEGDVWWQSPRRHRKPEAVGLSPDFFPDSLGEYFQNHFAEGGPGTGLSGIIYAASVLDSDHVFIIGVDFYDSGYARGWSLQDAYEEQEADTSGSYEDWVEKHENMKTCFDTIITSFSDTEFYLLTDSPSYERGHENLEIVGPESEISKEFADTLASVGG